MAELLGEIRQSCADEIGQICASIVAWQLRLATSDSHLYKAARRECAAHDASQRRTHAEAKASAHTALTTDGAEEGGGRAHAFC